MTRNIKTIPNAYVSRAKPRLSHPAPILLPVTASDIHELARIQVESLSSNLLLRLYFPDPAYFYRHLVVTFEQLFENNASNFWFVRAVTDEGELMGWGAWSARPAEMDLETETMKYGSWMMALPETEEVHGKENQCIFPVVAGLPEHIHKDMIALKNDWMLSRKHLFLNGIFTNPKFQGRGVGAAILEWGNLKADAQCLPCFVQSTPEAYELCKQAGWKDVGMLDVDLGNWVKGDGHGLGWGNYKISYLLRLPTDRREEERVRLVHKLRVAGLDKEVDDMAWGIDYY